MKTLNKIVQYKEYLVLFEGEIENRELICITHKLIAETDAELFAWWASKGYCLSALKGRFTATYYDGKDVFEFNSRTLCKRLMT